MLQKDLQRSIANATVRILKKEGQGVLVGGGLILTAAHCIDFDSSGKMALGDYFIEDIRTIEARKSNATEPNLFGLYLWALTVSRMLHYLYCSL